MKRLQVSLVVCSVIALPWLSGTSFAQVATDVVCTQCISSSDLANDSIGSAKIKDGTLASNDLAANAVKAANINNGAVTFNKLGAAVRDQLDGAIADVNFEFVYVPEEGVASAACPAETFAVSASCACNNNEGANNFGVLFFCATAGDGVVAGCFPNALTYDPQLPDPIAQAQATCMGATASDGTPWVPFPAGLAPNDHASVNEPQWRNEQKQNREATVASQRNQLAAFKQQIRK